MAAKPKKSKAQIHADEVNTRSAEAGYEVKDHGHRFFQMRLRVGESGEYFMPVGYKWVQFLWVDSANPGYVWAILKDEHLG